MRPPPLPPAPAPPSSWRRPVARLARGVRLAPRTPGALLALGFGGMILLGTLALTLPAASASGEPAPLLTALFTATSAVCVTGLTVVDTGTYWSTTGHVIIMLLLQVGGLGFMTSATLLFMILGRRVSLRHRLAISTELGATSMTGLEGVVRRIIVASLIIEAIGVVILTSRLLARAYPLDTALWYGLFHTVSGFTNGGFDLVGGVALFRDDAPILLTLSALIILGGLGITTLDELLVRRSFRRLSLTGKLVVSMTGLLLVTTTAATWLLERRNVATLGAMDVPTALLNAFFTAVVPRSGGFSTLDITALTPASLALTVVLMFIGAAPASTAGGIKITTMGALLATVRATVRGRGQAEAFGREIPQATIFRALTISGLAAVFVLGAATVLTVTDGVGFGVALFEVVSAFATCGLSIGLAPALSPTGQSVLIVLMFVGRLGPLTLALALAQAQRPGSYRYAAEAVRIG